MATKLEELEQKLADMFARNAQRAERGLAPSYSEQGIENASMDITDERFRLAKSDESVIQLQNARLTKQGEITQLEKQRAEFLDQVQKAAAQLDAKIAALQTEVQQLYQQSSQRVAEIERELRGD